MSIDDALHIARHLREPERRERLELWGRYDAAAFAMDYAARPAPAYTARTADGEPVVMGGLQAVRPQLAVAWMAGTDRWPEVVRDVTWHCRRVMGAVLDGGVHRIECHSPQWFSEAHAWYRLLGLRPDAALKGYGAGGETWVLFSRTSQKKEA